MSAEETDDYTLLRRVAGGDQDALRELYARYRPRLRRYLWYQLGGRRDDVEDLLQEIAVAIWRSAGSFRGEARVSTWIFQIAHHRVLRARRDSERHPERQLAWRRDDDDDEDADLHAPGAAVASHDSHEDVVVNRIALEQALGCLSPKHREVLDLVFVHGFAPDEVAQILDVPAGTVKSRLSYARRALLKSLTATAGGIEGTRTNG